MLFSQISQANVSLPVMLGDANPLEFPVDLGLWSLIIFLGLLAILTKFAWKPIIEGLDERELGIARNIDEAEAANQKAQDNLAQYEAKLASVNDEAAAILAEARSDATAIKEKAQAEASEEAQRTKDRALADIEAAKAAAVRELAESSVDTAVSLAGNIVGRSLDKNDHSSLIDQAVDRFSGSGA
jgi:F-type H+-transporting ATPase subunit b